MMIIVTCAYISSISHCTLNLYAEPSTRLSYATALPHFPSPIHLYLYTCSELLVRAFPTRSPHDAGNGAAVRGDGTSGGGGGGGGEPSARKFSIVEKRQAASDTGKLLVVPYLG